MRARRGRWSALAVVLAALLAAGAAALGVTELHHHDAVDIGPGVRRPRGGGKPLPTAGAYVPVYDLASDPVFPTLKDGFAIERHVTGGVASEHLAATDNSGRSWYLVGAPFPFPSGYTGIQFTSTRTGYVFGPAGLAITDDGGLHWQSVSLRGQPQRVIPVGLNVWATYTTCHGPPLGSTPCAVHLGVSHDGGLTWRSARAPSALAEPRSGGDILARVSLDAAYVLTYGSTGGAIAYTGDGGRTWSMRPDPCAAWRRAEMAAVSGSLLWLVCGGPPVLQGEASPKAVLRSLDGGHRWVLEASTGLGPPLGDAVHRSGSSGSRPVGSLLYAGQISQLATLSTESAWIGLAGVGVIVTTDGGKSWTLAQGMHDRSPSTPVGVTFDDPFDGWALAFHAGVWHTTDGVHWHLVDGSTTAG